MTAGTTLTLDAPFDDVVAQVREALGAEGFGVITEIDVRKTLQDKLGEQTDDYLILGACNPQLAHRALQVDPAVGMLLPCNVVVRRADGHTAVDLLDPQVMVRLTDEPSLKPVADDAAARLDRVAAALRRH